jgi:phosphopantothenoylcysteine decarboxylase/phosphopantothenate--cysteine ligase
MIIPPKCLISAGPTREWIDSVRYLSNPSSGKMGYAMAQAANSLGFEVTLVSGPVNIPAPSGITVIEVETASQMREVLLENFQKSELTIMAAAVSDHRPEFLGSKKVKKDRFPDTLKLIRNPDILAELGVIKSATQKLVGFAAESCDHLVNARTKLFEKNLDWIVVNDITTSLTGFQSELNEVTLLSRNEESITFSLSSKIEIATSILKQVWK